MLNRVKSFAASAWERWQAVASFVERNAKPIIFLLALMNLFGMIAPETATGWRDAVLALAL